MTNMYSGKKLRQLRQRLNLNQDVFAVELGISQPYYSSIESGKKKVTKKIMDVIHSKWPISQDVFPTDEMITSNEIIAALIYKIESYGFKSDSCTLLECREFVALKALIV